MYTNLLNPQEARSPGRPPRRQKYPRDVEIVQLHDTTILDLRVRTSGRLTINLDGVSVFHRVTPILFDVFIHRGRLEVSGLTKFSIEGPGWIKDADDYILDDTVTDELGNALDWVDLVPESVRNIELGIFSGAQIKVSCTRAEVRLSRKGELAHQWPAEAP
jgi:hypothetical protein